MAVRNALPFEFPWRWNDVRRIFAGLPDEAADFLDQRDRDLEDFLADLSDASGLSSGSPQLLCMAATADSILSGSDYVTFSSIIGQHGFADVVSATNSWTHPVAGVYVLIYEHAWATYTGGGTIQLELDGVVVPEGVLGDAASGQSGSGTVAYFAVAGQAGRIKVTQSSGSTQTFDGLMRVAISDPTGSGEYVALETLWMDTRAVASVTSSTVLTSGDSYRIVITGNYDVRDSVASGTGIAVLYPSTSASNDAGADAETEFGAHNSRFTVNLGSGAAHIEPVGGPYSTHKADHQYEYLVTGQGSAVTFAHGDSPISDNNGKLRIEILRGT